MQKTTLGNTTNWYAIHSKFASFTGFEKIQVVFAIKTSIFFKKKNPKFERFEEHYYFRRILRQICNNFLEKFTFGVELTADVGVNVIRKYCVRKRFNWEWVFAFIF